MNTVPRQFDENASESEMHRDSEAHQAHSSTSAHEAQSLYPPQAGGTAQHTARENLCNKWIKQNSKNRIKLPGHDDEDKIQSGQPGPEAGPFAEPVRHSKLDKQNPQPGVDRHDVQLPTPSLQSIKNTRMPTGQRARGKRGQSTPATNKGVQTTKRNAGHAPVAIAQPGVKRLANDSRLIVAGGL